jgi:hypothetical protein
MKIDTTEIKRQLDEGLARVFRGECLPADIRIRVGGQTMTIKQARRYLKLPDEPVIYAGRQF